MEKDYKEKMVIGLPPKRGIGYTPSEMRLTQPSALAQPSGFEPQKIDLDANRGTVTDDTSEQARAPKYTGNSDIIDMLSARQKTAEQQAEEARRDARRARTHKVVGGFADLGRALTNLFATANYAPNAYDPKQGMSEKAQERYDKALADYEAKREQALNYALNKAKYEAADNAAEYERWKDAEDMKRTDRKLDEIERKNKEKELLDAAKLDEQKSWHALQDARDNRRLSIADYKAISDRMRASSMVEYRRNGGNMTPYIVTTSYEYDPLTGKVTEVKKERTVGGGEVVISRVAVTNGEEVQQPASQATSGASQSAPYRTNNSTSKAPYVKQK